ncbi:energy transducer TonB [bacterium]|nr:energy transducer TonB [bacterium]
MKQILFILCVIGSCTVLFSQQEAPVYQSDTEILLPDFKQPLFKNMSLSEIKSAAPKRAKVRAEHLENGATLCLIDHKYALQLLLVDDKLVDLKIEAMKRKSKFGRWFIEAAESLPPDETEYTVEADEEDEHQTERWETPNSTWTIGSTSPKGKANYSILFSGALYTLPDGMVVRHKPSPDSTDSDNFSRKTKDVFETPPQPLRSRQPSYPDAARTRSITGKVVVKAYIDTQGKIKRWYFMKVDPIGFGFAQEVEMVLPYWQFEPAIQYGEPVGVWVAIPLTFRVRR